MPAGEDSLNELGEINTPGCFDELIVKARIFEHVVAERLRRVKDPHEKKRLRDKHQKLAERLNETERRPR